MRRRPIRNTSATCRRSPPGAAEVGAKAKVVITDYVWESLDVEHNTLGESGRALMRIPMLAALLLSLGAATTAFNATAADYPVKPIRLIVPFAAGGGNDAVARTIAQSLSAGLGQQVVVDNRAGAGGVVGAELAAKSPPDGYTLFLGGVGSHAINPSVHRNLPYDPVRDFAPISLIASAALILVVHPSLPAKSVEEFIVLAKAKPEAINYASNGNGSSSH